jgi:ferric iron reductase protein FhuF
MGNYYILLLIIPAAILFLLARHFIGKSKGNAVSLFKAALKEENTGRFEAAIIQYELALQEAEKKGFDKSLRLLISEKLKVLHTITEYEREMYVHPQVYKITPGAKL